MAFDGRQPGGHRQIGAQIERLPAGSPQHGRDHQRGQGIGVALERAAYGDGGILVRRWKEAAKQLQGLGA